MAKHDTSSRPRFLNGRCDCGRVAFPIAIANISCDGCEVEASGDWEDAYDFLHLTIDERIEINGKIVSLDGRKASIRFFGELHPCVVEGLGRTA